MAGNDGNTSNGTLQVDPSVWSETSHAIQTGNNESEDIKAEVLITLNDLMDSLGALSFIQGASNLSEAMSEFSSKIELSLGCVAVDISVVASGLLAASKAFGTLDSSLATMFNNLESQMSYFTTTTTIAPAHAATYTPLKTIGAEPAASGGSSIGHFFSHAWHDITNWSSDVNNSVSNTLSNVGAPGPVAESAGFLAGGLLLIGGLALAAG
jgi:hypothetical protein